MHEPEPPATPAASTPPTSASRFYREGLGYVYEPDLGEADGGIRLRLDLIKRGLEQHTGEVTIESTLPGMTGLLLQARFNLVSSTAQDNLTKAIKRVVEGTSDETLPWARWVRSFFAACLAAERAGEPFRRTGAEVPRTARLAPLVAKLVPNDQNVILYGPGGVGKGWLAVGMAVSVALGVPFAGYDCQQAPVLYLDWEDSYEVFCGRVDAIAAGLMATAPPLHYRACFGSLRDQAHAIARYASEQGIGLLVVDSVEMAAAVAGDGSSTWDDRARGVFESLRAIRGGMHRPLSVLLIDHLSEQARQAQSGGAKPYGSVFKTNWCRLGWEMRKQQESEALVSNVGLYQYKTNHTASMAAIGLRIEWDDPAEPHNVLIAADDVRDHDELAQRLGLKEQIKAALRGGPLSRKAIADQTGLSAEKVRVTLWRDSTSKRPWFIQRGDSYALREEEEPTSRPHLQMVRREPEPPPRMPYRDDDHQEEGINHDDDDILF